VGIFSKPKPPSNELTAAEEAQLKRNKSLLDEEIEESEKRLKAMSRGKLGYKSLLKGGSPSGPTGGGQTPSAGRATPSLIRPPGPGAR